MTKINSPSPIKIQSEIFKNTDSKKVENKQIDPLKSVANNIDTKKDTRNIHFIPKPIS